MPEWTAERISTMAREDVRALRENALRLGRHDIAELCDAALAVPKRSKQRRDTVDRPAKNSVVQGFHFVCPKETGVASNSDGTVWTGTWVVDARHAEVGAKIGAYVALHTAKSEVSYLQGTIKDWRRRPREAQYADDRPAKTRYGIDFLIELTSTPYEWQGDGSGEKGYAYVDPW